MDRSRLALLLLGTALALSSVPLAAGAGERLALPGLQHPVKVLTDELGVPHLYARSDHDVVLAQGYVHARDRFFQMDAGRRAAVGTLAELTGGFDALASDASARMLDLRAAAQRSVDRLEPGELALAQAFADGVNAWLATYPLPPEYEALELTSVPRWSVLDTFVLAAGLSASFGVRLWEIGETETVQSYVDALGEAGAAALYPADLGRFAPWVPHATVPDALGATPTLASAAAPVPLAGLARSAAAARRLRARAEGTILAQALEQRDVVRGSNAWGVAGSSSATGSPLLANDGHADLTAPARDYEIHLVVKNDPERGPLNVSGGSSPGVPGVGGGQNTRVAWAGTAFGPDLSDVFRDRLLRGDPGCAARLCIDSAGELHPVEERAESYRMNQVGNSVPDDLVDATATVAALAPEAVDVLSVPFRAFGPILEVEDRGVLADGPAAESSALTLQYTGLLGGRDAASLLATMRARDVFEFQAALRSAALPGGGGNWVVADVDGNLAYLAAAEVPLRADLEAGALAGPPPWLVRDGSGPSNWIPDPARSRGQVLPFAVIPFDEMPHVVNPPAGFVVTCNEDPSGFVADNDLVDQRRPSKPTALHYLGDIGTRGLRNGRVTALLRERIEAGEKLSIDDMKRIQANTQALHAELLVPHLLAAFAAAQRAGAPAELAALAADPRIVEAAGRLETWDFSHPTGIPEGYDASDADGVREPVVSDAEARASVAATLYNVWFLKLVARVRLSIGALGLTPLRPMYTFLWLLEQDPYSGVGSSGIDFVPEPAPLAAPDRRDLLLLAALGDALAALAGRGYAAAFARSSDQDDYRWGRLNRVVVEHALGGEASIPPAAGFPDLAPDLPGLARDGTWDTVNVSPAPPGAADSAQGFVNSFGSAFRRVHSPLRASASGAGMQAFGSLPGGASGDPANPTYASQLGSWLTVDYHELAMKKKQVRSRAVTTERFVPVKPKAARADQGGAHAAD